MPQPVPRTDVLFVESTHGNRRHPDEDPAEHLADIVGRTIERGGNLLLPSFAVGRAQALALCGVPAQSQQQPLLVAAGARWC